MNIYIMSFKYKGQTANYKTGCLVVANTYEHAVNLISGYHEDIDKRTLRCQLSATTGEGVKAGFEYTDWTIVDSADEVWR